MKVHRVDAVTLQLVEPLLAQWLASKHCHDTREAILERAASGKWTLYGVADGRDVIGLFALEVKETPRGERYLTAPFATGRRAKEWWPLMDETADHVAKEYGCSEIVQECRPGWRKWMSGRFAVAKIVLRREVT